MRLSKDRRSVRACSQSLAKSAKSIDTVADNSGAFSEKSHT